MKKTVCAALALLLTLMSASALADGPRAVSLMGSFAEAWAAAGGTLAGATEDAVSERGMALGEDVQIVGSTKAPNLELVAALDPELVIYSTEVAAQADAAASLEAMRIETRGYAVTTYTDYMAMLADFCALTGHPEVYQAQSESVSGEIEKLIAEAQADPRYGTRSALLIRAFSTGAKAKGSDNLAGAMLKDMGLDNIADTDGTLLENLTLEAIIADDPDYIFVVTMGSDDAAAMAALADGLTNNPAWTGLTAVREGRYIVLDRTLFHLKPNARWAESYRTLYALLYAAA